jgi:chromosome segregation ATPase
MATDPYQSPSLLPEIGPDGLPRENSVIAYTEKIIEAEQLQLRKYIEENYSKIRDVERELSNLTLEMKLTAGPKKAALEHLRKKIELSTEKIRLAKLKEEEARKAWESASKDVKDEEALKQKLCEDLNNLVQESSSSQFARLEELKRRLEALNPSRSNYGTNSTGTAQNGVIPDISSSSPSTVGPTGNELNQENAKLANGQSQQPNNSEVVGKLGKKKIMIQNKVKGIGTIPKGRGSSAPGWTGAGFDVEART